MSHSKRKKHTPKVYESYTPILTSHGNIQEISEAIIYQIQLGWITEDEFDQIYKIIKRKLKEKK